MSSKIPVTVLGAEAPTLRSRKAREQERSPGGCAPGGGRSRWRRPMIEQFPMLEQR